MDPGVEAQELFFLNSPDSVSYWGSYFKYRKTLLSLGAGAAAGCRCCVRLGAWVLVPLQGRCRVRLGAWVPCRVQLLCAFAAAVCSLELGYVARVHFGAWVLLPSVWLGVLLLCAFWSLGVVPLPAVCLLELGCWCRCDVPLPDAWLFALWSLGAAECRGSVLPTKVFLLFGIYARRNFRFRSCAGSEAS